MNVGDVITASRPILWNIPLGLVVYMYAGMVVALAIAAWGVWRRVRVWRLGKPELRTDHWPQRLKRVTVDALLQRVVVRERAAGLAHAALWTGFVVLFGATLVVMAQMDLVVYNSFVGPFSLGVNYYDKMAEHVTINVNIGYILFNRKALP